MAGNLTNMRYDRSAFNEEVRRSTKPLSYKLDTNNYVNCNRCFAPYGQIAGDEGADFNNMGEQIDVDSVLRGYTRISSKSNEQQKPESLKQYKTFARKDCPKLLESEYTRYTSPAYELKGLTTPDLRFDYPLYDPQCQIFENFEVNTRLQAKDNFRAVWHTPINQCDAMPKEAVNTNRDKNRCQLSLNCNYAKYVA